MELKKLTPTQITEPQDIRNQYIPSMSLKLLPILGVPSLPPVLLLGPVLRSFSFPSSALCLGLNGPGPGPAVLGPPLFSALGAGMSLAELAIDELTSRGWELVSCSLLASPIRVLGCWRLLAEGVGGAPSSSREAEASCARAKGNGAVALLSAVWSSSSLSS